MMKTSQKPVIAGLKAPRVTQYVGVAEVCEALGISRSTMDRQRREGCFPPGVQVSKNRVVWPVEVVEQHLGKLATHLATHAKANPDDLSPEEAADLAPRLAATALGSTLGRAVDPNEVGFTLARQMSDLEAAAVSGLDRLGSAYAAGWMLPALRADLTALIERLGGKVPASDAEWRNEALAALERDCG